MSFFSSVALLLTRLTAFFHLLLPSPSEKEEKESMSTVLKSMNVANWYVVGLSLA